MNEEKKTPLTDILGGLFMTWPLWLGFTLWVVKDIGEPLSMNILLIIPAILFCYIIAAWLEL